MTPEQAIKILSSETSLEAVEELKYYAGFNQDKVIEQIQMAMDMGAIAIGKQVGMKPIRTNAHGFLSAWCPSCGKELGSGIINSFCYKCGQKIDWEGVKESE